MNRCIQICMYMCTCMYICVCMYMCIYICVSMYICVCIYIVYNYRPVSNLHQTFVPDIWCTSKFHTYFLYTELPSAIIRRFVLAVICRRHSILRSERFVSVIDNDEKCVDEIKIQMDNPLKLRRIMKLMLSVGSK